MVFCVALLGWLRETTSCGRSLKNRAASREGGVRHVAGLVSGEETIVKSTFNKAQLFVIELIRVCDNGGMLAPK